MELPSGAGQFDFDSQLVPGPLELLPDLFGELILGLHEFSEIGLGIGFDVVLTFGALHDDVIFDHRGGHLQLLLGLSDSRQQLLSTELVRLTGGEPFREGIESPDEFVQLQQIRHLTTHLLLTVNLEEREVQTIQVADLVQHFILNEFPQLSVVQEIRQHVQAQLDSFPALEWLLQPALEATGAARRFAPVQHIEDCFVADQDPLLHLLGEDLQRLNRSIIQPHARSEV